MIKCNAKFYYKFSFPNVEDFYGLHNLIRIKIVLDHERNGLKNISILNKCYTLNLNNNNNNNNNKSNNLFRNGM